MQSPSERNRPSPYERLTNGWQHHPNGLKISPFFCARGSNDWHETTPGEAGFDVGKSRREVRWDPDFQSTIPCALQVRVSRQKRSGFRAECIKSTVWYRTTFILHYGAADSGCLSCW